MAEHRWQGYSHDELYKAINAGPGPSASHASMERWAGVSAALTEINADLHAGIMSSGASWEGKAADTARAGLNPLAAWADDARTGSEVMRISAELQADHISKARSDMPAPVKVTAEQPNALVTGLTHLFGGQTDHEEQEAAADAAEKRAREVMSTYASSTTANTATLGQFHQPPQLVINSSQARAEGSGALGFAPMAVPQGTGGVAARRGSTTGGRQVSTPPPAAKGGATTGGTATPGATTRTSGTTTHHTSGGTSTSSAAAAAGSSGTVGTSGAVVPGQQQRRAKQEMAEGSTAVSGAAAAGMVPGQMAAAVQNLASSAPMMGTAGTIGGGSDTVHKKTVAAAPQSFDPFGTMGPRRGEDEEDLVHNAADYLRETDDIYGVGSYTLPVIGESTTD